MSKKNHSRCACPIFLIDPPESKSQVDLLKRFGINLRILCGAIQLFFVTTVH